MHTKHGSCRCLSKENHAICWCVASLAGQTCTNKENMHPNGAPPHDKENRQMNIAKLNRWINVGQVDRMVRMLMGIGCLLIAWMFDFPWAFWGGMAFLITAAVGICPIYALFKISTLALDGPKTVIPWEEFLDLLPAKPEPDIVQAPAPVQRTPKAAPPIVPVAFRLPPELTQALITDVQRNALDEMLVVRFYENFFGCRIGIEQSGHLSVYVCKFPNQTITLNFAKLKGQLLERLQETAQPTP